MRKISKLFSFLLYKTRVGRLVIDTIASLVMERIIKIKHNSEYFYLTVPNHLNHWRVKTFSLKEPETLEWIGKIKKGSVLWDTGTNIGLYSIYSV